MKMALLSWVAAAFSLFALVYAVRADRRIRRDHAKATARLSGYGRRDPNHDAHRM